MKRGCETRSFSPKILHQYFGQRSLLLPPVVLRLLGFVRSKEGSAGEEEHLRRQRKRRRDRRRRATERAGHLRGGLEELVAAMPIKVMKRRLEELGANPSRLATCLEKVQSDPARAAANMQFCARGPCGSCWCCCWLLSRQEVLFWISTDLFRPRPQRYHRRSNQAQTQQPQPQPQHQHQARQHGQCHHQASST